MIPLQKTTFNAEDLFVHFCLAHSKNEGEEIKNPHVHPGQTGLNFWEMIPTQPERNLNKYL